MAGLYHKNNKEQIQFLKNWMQDVIENKLWEKYENLHLDEIDGISHQKKDWIKESLYILESILSLIDEKKYDVLLAIPLMCILKNNSKIATNLKYIENELAYEPPSFYLFLREQENFVETIEASTLLNEVSKEINFKSYYSEVIENEECYRTIFVKK